MLQVELERAYKKGKFRVCCELLADRIFSHDYPKVEFNQLLYTGPEDSACAISWVEWYLREAKYPLEKSHAFFSTLTNNFFLEKPALFRLLLMPTNNKFFSLQPNIPFQEILLQINTDSKKILIKRMLHTGSYTAFYFLTHYNEKGACDNFFRSWILMLGKEQITSSFKSLPIEAIIDLFLIKDMYDSYFGNRKSCIQSLRFILFNSSVLKIKELIINLCKTHDIAPQELYHVHFTNQQAITFNQIFHEVKLKPFHWQFPFKFFCPISSNEEIFFFPQPGEEPQPHIKMSSGPITSFKQFEERFALLKQSVKEETNINPRK